MPITLVTGPANAGKAQVVMEAVRLHLARGQDPLLVVPTRTDAHHYMRELAGEGVAMGARVERFSGLIEEAARRAGTRAPLLGGVARERILEALAGPGGSQPGLVRSLGELVGELQQRRVGPARLIRALADWAAADGPQAAHPELGRIYGDYEALLDRLGRTDPERQAARAMDALRLRPALWGATPVLFYGFDDLTPLQLDVIETLGRIVGAEVAVSLAYEPERAAFAGRAASFQALLPLADEHRALGARAEHYAPDARGPLSHLERSLFEATATRAEPGGAVNLLEGGGERAELELVAAEILGLLRRGTAAEEIAVLARLSGPALDLLEEVFSGAGIPFALRRGRPFAATSTGAALIGLLRCVPQEQPDGGGELADLLAWLRAPGLLERPELADALERRARRSGVTGAQGARAMWEERHWPLEAIDQLAAAQRRGPAALLDRVSRELLWLFTAPRRRQAHVLEGEELEEAGALAAGRRALGELRELARVAPELVPGTAADLARALERIEVLSGQEPGPGLVSVLDPLALRARRVRALFVCGLQEGVFPRRSRPLPFLVEEERRRLAELTGLRVGEARDSLADERYLLYAALSRPEERLFLSWHVADDDGDPTSRSLFIDDVCDLFEESLAASRIRRALGTLDGPRPAVARDPEALARMPLRDERLLEELRGRIWSASSIERWIRCPVSWFVERMLRPDALEPDPEPFARGGLAHAALKDTLDGLRRETGTARVTPARLDLARRLLREALAANEHEYPLSVEPERRTAVRRRLQADLDRFLQYACESGSPLEPGPLELGFGFTEEETPGDQERLPALDLGGGLMLRGRIDRVDVGEGGEALVYDYKSTQAPPAAKWLPDANLQVALYMRAVEDLLDLRVVGGFYQPLAGSDLRPRGLMDGDSGVEVDCLHTDVLEHEEFRELLGRAVAAAREATREAGSGLLEPRPATCAFRGGCRFPTICRCER